MSDEQRSQRLGDSYLVVFDGGAKGNPGQGYGSFHISGPAGFLIHERREYGDGITNNVAEYRTLIAALQRLQERIGNNTAVSSVRVVGDSALVINQANGVWKVKKAWLQPLRDEVIGLLQEFREYTLSWQDRSESVRVLGH